MGYRFLDDYDPRKEQKKKQQQKGTQKAPPSGNPLNPAAQNNKNNKTNTGSNAAAYLKGHRAGRQQRDPGTAACAADNSAEADKVRHPDADTDTAGADIEAAQHSGLRCGGLQ